MEQPRRGVEHYRDPSTNKILAIVVRSDIEGDKYNFLTTPESSMQVGVNFYQAGDRIRPHLHLEQERRIGDTQELIYISRGRVRLRLYDDDRHPLETVELREGDAVLLAGGGHGFDVIDKTRLIEAKQGPFLEGADKIVFD